MISSVSSVVVLWKVSKISWGIAKWSTTLMPGSRRSSRVLGRGNDQVFWWQIISHIIYLLNSFNISYIVCIYHIHIWQSYDKHTYMTDIWHYDWIYKPCLLPARWSREVSWVVTTLGTIQMWCDTDGQRESTLFPTDHRRTPRGSPSSVLQVSFKSPSTWIYNNIKRIAVPGKSLISDSSWFAGSFNGRCMSLHWTWWDFDVEARAVLERAAEFNRLGSQVGWIASRLAAEHFSPFSYCQETGWNHEKGVIEYHDYHVGNVVEHVDMLPGDHSNMFQPVPTLKNLHSQSHDRQDGPPVNGLGLREAGCYAATLFCCSAKDWFWYYYLWNLWWDEMEMGVPS